MRAPMGQLQQILAGELGRLPKASGGSTPNINRQMQDVLQAGAKFASSMQDEFISTEHLLLALTNVDSPVKRILQMNAVDEASLQKAIQSIRGSAKVTACATAGAINVADVGP